MQKEKILDINICITDYNELKNNIDSDIQKNKKSYIIAVNPEKIMISKKDNKMKEIINSATYQIPDGIGVIYASRLKGGKLKNRITGIDCMHMILNLANERRYSVFLFGGYEEDSEKIVNTIKEKYPNVNIVGQLHGFEFDDKKIIKEINSVKPDILFVAVASPRQELWVNKYMDDLSVNIFQTLGGSFDVLANRVKRAPKWMQKCGLEWLYRLIRQPKRIFRQFNLIKFMFIVLFNKDK